MSRVGSLFSDEHMAPPSFIFQAWEMHLVSTFLLCRLFFLFFEHLSLLYSLEQELSSFSCCVLLNVLY